MDYVYALPMLVVVSLFRDFKYTVKTCAIILLLNVIQVVYEIRTTEITNMEIAGFEQRFAVILLVGLATVVSAYVINRANKNRMEELAREKEIIDENLKIMQQIAEELNVSCTKSEEKIGTVSENSADTVEQIKEMDSGISNTVELIQEQLLKTDQIQSASARLGKEIALLNDIIIKTNQSVSSGQTEMKQLLEECEESKQAGGQITGEIQQLNEETSRMHEIINDIDNISKQTKLLALNASIEAARAGDAGKGFAVVADEIGKLSEMTSSSTVTIRNIINSVISELDNMIERTSQLIENNEKQGAVANQQHLIMARIDGDMNTSVQSIEKLNEVFDTLNESNAEVIGSIQNVSAITEELKALSSTTLDKTNSTNANMLELQEMILKLKEDAVALNKA